MPPTSDLLIKEKLLRIKHLSEEQIPALPFSVFRFSFGLLMVFGSLRFVWLGWIEDHYTDTIVHFYYWGFSWIPHFPAPVLYAMHYIMALAGLGVAISSGILYRISAITLFIIFTYTELIDLTYYLNHYYYVSIVCFLLCIIPSPTPVLKREYTIPAWVEWIFKIQIAIVYIYAGLAKINYDWLILAMPLKIWLPAHDQLPIIGTFISWEWSPYIFSWGGMLYDCLIVFFLAWRKTRIPAFIIVIIFHTIVGILFQIGVFPLVMIAGTLIFFKFDDNLKTVSAKVPVLKNTAIMNARLTFLVLFFIFQLLFPWRYLLYSGNLFWTEEGYRFS